VNYGAGLSRFRRSGESRCPDKVVERGVRAVAGALALGVVAPELLVPGLRRVRAGQRVGSGWLGVAA
jgi:hypothetical protein